MTERSLKSRDHYLANFYDFCQDVLRMPLSELPHREMAEFLSSPYSANRLLLVPRGCWKTSLGSISYPLWMVLRAWFLDGNPTYRVLIDSATVRLSKMVISTIEATVKNSDTFEAVFGNLYDRKGRVDEGFSLSFRLGIATGIKEPNFLPSGVGAEKTGLHFELIVMDDVVTKENTYTPTGRDKVYNHYRMMQGIMESTKAEGQTTVLQVTGTRYHDDDTYGRIIKEDAKAVAEGKSPLFTQLIRQAINYETGELYYPDKLDKDELERRKRQMGVLFFAQFQNDPNQENAPFKREWLKWKPLMDFPKLQYRRLTVDPALKTDQTDHGDYTAMVVMGWDHFHWPYVCDVTMKDNMTPGVFIDEFFRLCMTWDVKAAIIEAEHQESLEYLLRLEMHRRAYFVNIRWEKVSRNYGKMTRWAEIQPYAERGGVHIAEEIPSDVRIEIQDQWERAPVASHDDFMDALSLQMLYLPIEFEKDGGRFPIGQGQAPAELMEDAKRQQAEAFNFGTLAQSFPHIKALQPRSDSDDVDETDTVEDEIYQQMMKTFSGGANANQG